MLNKMLILVAMGIILLCASVNAQQNQLPQDHDYQVVLRNYIAGLSQSDFDVPFRDLTYDNNHLDSLNDDELYDLWLIFRNAPPQGPIASVLGLTVSSSHFTLHAIEQDGIQMGSTTIRPWFPPETTAWWAGWDYPGNPYHQNQGVMNRAFVYSTVEMMMLDNAHENGKYKRSDYLGGTLIWMAYVYGIVKENLPQNVRNAYETGLRKFMTRLEQWGSDGNLGDMQQAAHVSMWYVAKAIDEPALYEKAAELSAGILDASYRPAGYITHGDGFDAPYNGFSIYYLNWAALVSENPLLKQTVGELSKLKGYLSLPDPDGRMYGPSHFNTTTSTDSPNDLNNSTIRDVGAAMLSDHGKYLIWEGRNGQNVNLGVPSREEIKSRISLLTTRTNNHWEASSASPTAWSETHWGTGIPNTAGHIVPDFYNEITELINTDSPLTKAPFNREENFIKQFPEEGANVREAYKREFLSAKFDDYGVVLHTGRLSWWGGENTTNMSGFGGGAISAFWTPQGGSIILGRTAGFQGPQPDTWDNWRQWPTHAISGLTSENDPFSSARNRYPVRSYDVTEDRAIVNVSGSIGNSHDSGRTTRGNALPDQVDYNRNFKVDSNGLTVETGLSSDGQDQIKELYEVIPIFLGNGSAGVTRADVSISLEANDNWNNATTSAVSGVTRVRIKRFTETVYITFDSPRIVKLAPITWQDSYQSDVIMQNLLIDLLENNSTAVNMPKSASVHYTISSTSQKPVPIEVTTPGTPNILEPAHQATETELDPVVKWESVEGADSYSFRLSTDNNFDNTQVDINNISDNIFQLNNLEPNTIYYYAVKATIGSSSGEWTPVRSFTTAGTPVSIEGEEGIPRNYELEDNYPNPFNPTTQINYALPEAEHVTLEVFDITGRLVTTLVNESQTAGYHQINFNADNLASGVYIYRLQAGNFIQTKQMTLVK